MWKDVEEIGRNRIPLLSCNVLRGRRVSKIPGSVYDVPYSILERCSWRWCDIPVLEIDPSADVAQAKVAFSVVGTPRDGNGGIPVLEVVLDQTPVEYVVSKIRYHMVKEGAHLSQLWAMFAIL